MKSNVKRRLQSGIALLCSLVLMLSVISVSAEDAADLESKTSELQSQLDGINQEMLEISNEIASTEMQVEIINGEILRTQESLASAQEKEAQQYEDMKTRIKYMYETDNVSLLEMLFNSDNMTDFLNKADFIQNISDYDRSMLEELRATHQEIADKESTLKIQQESLTELQTQLLTRQNELTAQAEATSTDLAEYMARLEQIRAEEAGIVLGYDSTVINTDPVSVNNDELTLFAAILECEAYQDYDCLLAVATVIMNRLNSPVFGDSISAIVYAPGQFEPVWTGRLDTVLSRGPSDLSYQVAQDALNGARLQSVADCYYFLYAGSTNRGGVNVGNNLFFRYW